MRKDANYFMVLAAVFYLFFLLLTPLGVFNDWIPPQSHTGYYSITTIDRGDDAGYYAYLRSIFFDGDLDFINEHYYAHSEKFTPTGYVFNNWQIGQAVLFFPFFLIGHFLALFFNAIGYHFSLDGYSPPYYISTAVASQTYMFIGVLLLFQILRKKFNNNIALLSTLFIWAGTSLLYYTFIRQRMAHSVEFCVSVVFLYYWLKNRSSDDYLNHALLGGLVGFLCIIRVINVGFLALYFVDQIVLLRAGQGSSLLSITKKLSIRTVSFSILFFAMFIPQIYAWNQINGVPYPTRHTYFAEQGVIKISFLHVVKKILIFFLGMRWGMVFSTPLLIVGLIGILKGNDYFKSFQTALCTYLTILFLMIILYPEDSDAYGHRHLISAIPILALGLAAILNKLSRKYYFVGFLLLCVLAQYIMIAQYKVTLPYDDPRFTIKALTGAPGFITHHYDQILRSTNLVRLLFLGHFNNWDFTDVLFLLISPFSQLISIVLVCLGFLYIPKITDRGFFFNTKIITGLILLLSIILTSIVWITAPPKTAEEISKRKEYSELIKKADVLEKAGQYDEAIEIFSNAFTLLPIAWKPLFRIAVLWNKKNNLPEANRYYAMVLNIIPNQPETLFSLGNNLMSLGKFKEAEHYLKTAIRQKPRNKNYYNVLAQVYAKTNRPAEAEDIFKEAINLDPAFSDSYINLAILYTITNRQGKALPYLKEGIRLGARGDSIIKLAEHYGLSLE